MELRELEWFVVLAETEHVTIAAAQLNISQPTLSRALSRLERRLGVRLFDRQQNRLRLNKYGEIFQAHAMRAMNEIAQANERITTLVDPDRGLVSVGCLVSFGGWLVPELLAEYRAQSPSTSFEVHGSGADTIVDDVRKGRIDVGFVGPRPVADDLLWVPLGRQDLRLGVPVGHRFEERDSISAAELEGEPMIGLFYGYGLRHVTNRLFAEAGVTPNFVIEVSELETVRVLVEKGMGIAIVPAPPPQIPAPRTIPLTDAYAYRQYGAIARHNGPNGHAAQRFLNFVAQKHVPRAQLSQP